MLEGKVAKAQALQLDLDELSKRISQSLLNEIAGERGQVADKFFDTTDIVSSVATLKENIQEEIEDWNQQEKSFLLRSKLLISKQRGLEDKIQKRRHELERRYARWDSLKHIRSAYADEYEQLEDELRLEYESHVLKLRNIDFLESELLQFRQNNAHEQMVSRNDIKKRQKEFFLEENRRLHCSLREEGDSISTSLREGDISISTSDRTCDSGHGNNAASLSPPSSGHEYNSQMDSDTDSDDSEF